MITNKKLEFPICKDCGNRHYRKAGKPCEYEGETKKEVQNKMARNKKQVVINLFDVSDYITKKLKEEQDENYLSLSKIGRDDFDRTINFAFPIRNIIIEDPVESFQVARFIVSKIQEELCLMTFEWYGKLYKEIDKYLQTKLKEVQ